MLSGMAVSVASCGEPSATTPRPAAVKTLLTVKAVPGAITGKLSCQGQVYDCMLGRSGIVSAKHEGDGGTPSGIFALREIRYRADRLAAPQSGLTRIQTAPSDGWCDAPEDPNYNLPVRLPYPASTEALWRSDGLYDAFAVIGYNDTPPVAGLGSAIFLHVMREQNGVGQPTAGCVSLRLADLLTVLASCGPQSSIRIRSP